MAFVTRLSPEYRTFDEIKSEINEIFCEIEKKEAEAKRSRYG